MKKNQIILLCVAFTFLINVTCAEAVNEITIENYTVWKNENIELNGNIVIVEGGTLVIDNSEVKFKNNYSAEHGLRAYGNGKFILKNGSTFGTNDMDSGCNILLFDEAEVQANDSTFMGLTGDLTQTVSALKGSFVLYRSGKNSYFYNTTFKNSYRCMNTYATDLTVLNCTFENIKNIALSPAYCNFVLKNSTFKNFPSSSYPLMPQSLHSSIIENNYFENISENSNYCIDLLYYNNNVIIRKNNLNNTIRAIVINSNNKDITIENNYIHDNPTTGLFTGISYKSSNITIRNNTGNNMGEGIVSIGHGATGYDNENIQIYGNILTNQGSYGPALSVQMQNSSVYDNIFQAGAFSKVAGLKTLNYTSNPKGKTANVVFTNNTFDGYNYGMEFHSAENITFINCIVKNSTSYDIAFFDGDNKNHKFINTFFDENKVYFDNEVDTFEPYWYANIRVVDENGIPVSEAKVNITNIIDPDCTPLCINGEQESNFLTNDEGYIQSIKNKEDTIIIQDYFQSKSTKVEYEYNITAEKDDMYGYFVINPNITFYCQDSDTQNNIITVVLQKKNDNNETTNTLTYLSPSINTVSPGEKFKLSACIDPTTEITGAQVDFLFNSSMVSANNVTEGDLFNQNGASTFFNAGIIDNSEGKINNIYGSIIGTSSVSTPGTLATINLTAGSTAGIAEFNLSDVHISDFNSESAPTTITGASILIDTAPVLAPIEPKSVDEKSTLTFNVSAEDADGDSLTYSVSELPEDAEFTTLGAFTWTPAEGRAGVYTLTFEVNDGHLTDSKNTTITVNKFNNPPVIYSFEPLDGSNFSEGERIGVSVNASDAEGQALSYSIRIDGVEYSTETTYIWGTDYSSSGDHTLEVTVSDGIDEVKEQHTIYISDCHPRWDVNEDGVVNILDITSVSQLYGTTVNKPYPRYDVNQDGVINIQDLTLVGYHFGEKVE